MSRILALLIAAALSAAACAPAVAPPAAPAVPAAAAVPAGPPPTYPTTPPQPGPASALTLPAPVERTLTNGLRVVYVSRPSLPIVQAVLVTRGGLSDDPARQPGLAAFTAAMLDEGAGGRSALELASALDRLGATLYTGAGWDNTQIGLQVLRGQMPEALRLMADVAYRPDFPEAEIRRLRDERLTELARGRDEARVIAGNAFAALLYGRAHPYGRLATTESVRRIDHRAIADFHRQQYRPNVSTLILVGAIGDADHAAVEAAFGAWRRGNVPALNIPQPQALQGTRIFLVDRPGAPQSEIRIGHPAVARNNPDFYPLQVLNTLLGGSFTSRLQQNLRETHGYTYGASSSFGMRLGAGPFMAGAAVVTPKTDSAVIEFFRELNRIRDEAVPADELERAKQFVALGLPQQLETSAQIAQSLAGLVTHGLPLDYFNSYVQQVMAVSAADVQRVARQYLHPDRSAIVVVGDQRVIEAGLRALPVGQVEIRRVDEFVR